MSLKKQEWFWAKVDRKEGHCWNWLAYKKDGYGVFQINHKPRGGIAIVRQAHRIAYELLRGPVPAYLVLDHLCENRACVNPDHLNPTTLIANTARSPRWAGNRTHCPKGHPYSQRNTLWHKSRYGRRCSTCAAKSSRATYQRKHPNAKPYKERIARLDEAA